MSAQLIQGYDPTIEALLTEIDSVGAGDRVVLNVYLLEDGETSKQVLDAMQRAAHRGAQVDLSVDGTAASKLSRLVERTTTLIPEALALAKSLDGFTAVQRRDPDHSKYVLFLRKNGPTSALWGGINLGDRFKPWRDFMVRLEGPDAAALAHKVGGEAVAASYPPPPSSVRFVANLPRHDQWEIRPIYRALAEDSSLRRLRIAMAYIDRAGARILRAALARGARVDLLVPRQANVYHHANMRTVAKILDLPGLRVFTLPHMLHAKALLGYDRSGVKVAYLGSANLKRNSFRMFKEVNALVTQMPFAVALHRAFEALFEESEQLTERPAYNRAAAIVEERFG